MTKTQSISGFLLVGVMTLLMAACASQEGPARTAMDGVNAAMSAAQEDAKKYVPEKYNEVLKQVNALKLAFNRRKFEDVIAGAPAAVTAAQGLVPAAAAGKVEYMKVVETDWAALTAAVPALISVVEVQGEKIEKSRKPPEGLDLPTARRGLADARTMWAQAQEAATKGQLEFAVDTAKKAKRRGESAAKALKVALPEAPAAPAPAA